MATNLNDEMIMSPRLQQSPASIGISAEAADSLPAGWLRGALSHLGEAWRLSAHHRVALQLEGLGDVRLIDPSFSAAEIAAIRSGRCVADVLAQRSLPSQ